MSKAKTPEKKAAAKQAAAEKKGKKYLVTFDHTYEDSEGIYANNSQGQRQYTGHDKQVRTTVKHRRIVDSEEKATALKAKFPHAKVEEYKGKGNTGELK